MSLSSYKLCEWNIRHLSLKYLKVKHIYLFLSAVSTFPVPAQGCLRHQRVIVSAINFQKYLHIMKVEPILGRRRLSFVVRLLSCPTIPSCLNSSSQPSEDAVRAVFICLPTNIGIRSQLVRCHKVLWNNKCIHRT